MKANRTDTVLYCGIVAGLLCNILFVHARSDFGQGLCLLGALCAIVCSVLSAVRAVKRRKRDQRHDEENLKKW